MLYVFILIQVKIQSYLNNKNDINILKMHLFFQSTHYPSSIMSPINHFAIKKSKFSQNNVVSIYFDL